MGHFANLNTEPVFGLEQNNRAGAVTRVTPPTRWNAVGCVFFSHPAIVRQARLTRSARYSSAFEERAQGRRLEHGRFQLDHSWADRGLHASKILNRTGSGLILDLVLGMVGAAVGGFIFSGLFGMSGVTGLNIWSIIVSVIGAIVVLWVYEKLIAKS